LAPLTLKSAATTTFVPDGDTIDRALSRVTHLGIGAHQDDLEIMAFHGIKTCFADAQKGFAGIICTNGEGSPQIEGPSTPSGDEIIHLRHKEQEQAALLGNYSLLVQLGYTSHDIKGERSGDVLEDLLTLLNQTQPEIVYMHNLADKHDTHVAVAVASILAMRRMEITRRPHKVYGCEVWRSLDWLEDEAKVLLDVGGDVLAAEQLIKIYKSQIYGGKRYDQAVLGRARSNATFFQSHAVDEIEKLWYAMDLTPLIQSDSRDMVDFITSHIDQFHENVEKKIKKSLFQFSKGEE